MSDYLNKTLPDDSEQAEPTTEEPTNEEPEPTEEPAEPQGTALAAEQPGEPVTTTIVW